jgi:hypothetical protein
MHDLATSVRMCLVGRRLARFFGSRMRPSLGLKSSAAMRALTNQRRSEGKRIGEEEIQDAEVRSLFFSGLTGQVRRRCSPCTASYERNQSPKCQTA